MHPQLAMGAIVSFFFSGFVMGKVPFSLSPRFRPMLQRGVDLASLDVSYFTGGWMYIICMYIHIVCTYTYKCVCICA